MRVNLIAVLALGLAGLAAGALRKDEGKLELKESPRSLAALVHGLGHRPVPKNETFKELGPRTQEPDAGVGLKPALICVISMIFACLMVVAALACLGWQHQGIASGLALNPMASKSAAFFPLRESFENFRGWRPAIHPRWYFLTALYHVYKWWCSANARVKCVCEPLPTWAAPATPPRREVPTAVAVGAGAAGAGAGMCCDGDTSAPSEDWHKSVSSDDTLDTQRARLEATRKELLEKMSQLRKLEASLSLAVGDAEDLEKDEKHEKDEKDEKEENEEKDEKDEKDEKEDAVPLAPRGPRDLGARRSKAVATDTDDLVALCKAERPGAVGAVGAVGAGASQEGEGGRRSVPRVTPSSPGPGPAGPSGPSTGRVRRTNSPGAQRPETGKESEKESKAKAKNEKELLHEKERPKRQSSLKRSASARSRISLFAPISARLGSRTSSRATIGAADTSGTSGSSGPSGSSGTSVLARSSSARELSRPGTGILEAADVARLVASPEIGTLDDFLPNPVPQPEVLSARAPRATPVAFLAEASALLQPPCPSCRKKYMAGATFCHNCGQKRRTPAAQASRRGSGTSPQTTPAGSCSRGKQDRQPDVV
ncbi:unnamed protein product [Effrenium voratum]|nr:unnamed protein product [Effrenium voratum]